MDNPNAVVLETHKYGKGVFARLKIEKGEVIAVWDGPVYRVEKCSDLPNNPPFFARFHAIQFSKNEWRDSVGIARYLNHSCDPNCGYDGCLTLVAMRTIIPNEELTWDYEMSEDSDFIGMECKCGSPLCRGIIRAHRFMPLNMRERYGNYLSDWVIKKYGYRFN